MRLLGIDPGIRNTGWGVIEMQGSRLGHVANGVIRPDPSLPDAARLQAIANGIDMVVQEHQPDRSAIEAIFVAKSASSALKLGMARGVAMMRCAAMGLPVDEISAKQVKKAVVGTGTADKSQVSAMVTRLLSVTAVNADAADALAIAIAAGHGETLPIGRAVAADHELAAGGGLSAAIEAALARDHAGRSVKKGTDKG